MSSCRAPHQAADTSLIKSHPSFPSAPSFLPPGFPPNRSGTRPTTLNCLPHAQVTDQSPDVVNDLLQRKARELLIDTGLATAGHSNVSMPSSFPAFHLSASHPIQSGASMIGGQGDREFAHFHGRYIDPDSSEGKAHRGIPWQSWQGGGLGSMHLTLSLTDAVRVIEAGWGEPHLLAGKMAAAGLLLVYAPRDEQEVDVVISILRASVDNARGAKIG